MGDTLQHNDSEIFNKILIELRAGFICKLDAKFEATLEPKLDSESDKKSIQSQLCLNESKIQIQL